MTTGIRAATAVAAATVLTGLLGAQPPTAAPAEEDPYAPTMLVLDASGSMKGKDPDGGTKIAAAKRAVHGVVDAAPADSKVGLAVYGTGTGNSDAEKSAGCKDIKVLRGPETIDKPALNKTVDGLKPSGYTPIGRALQTAAKELPDSGPRSIVLVSDGEDTCAPPDPCEVAKGLADAGIDLVVHAVGFGVDDKAREQLACVAQATGGTYTEAPDAGALERQLPRVTTAALRNYEPAGTPVRGGERPDDAPVLEPGQYLDTVRPTTTADGVQYYSVDAPRGSTIYVNATVPGASQWPAADDVRIESRGPDGGACEKQVSRGVTPDAGGVAGATLRLDTTDSDFAGCEGGGRYTFAVYYVYVGKGSDRKPLELLVGVEPPAEGAVGSAGNEEVPFEQPSGKPAEVTGGGSFGTAATLDGSGRYADAIRHSEYVFYRVRVDWGQALKYKVHFDRSAVGEEARATTVLYSPYRQPFDGDSWGYTGDQLTLDGVTDDNGIGGIPVRYANRENIAPEDSGPSVAGWYYIGVRLDPSSTASGAVPMVLDVDVSGDPEPAPYRGDAFGSDKPAQAEPTDDQTRPAADVTDADDDGGSWVPWLAGGVGVVGLLTAVGSVLLWRRV